MSSSSSSSSSLSSSRSSPPSSRNVRSLLSGVFCNFAFALLLLSSSSVCNLTSNPIFGLVSSAPSRSPSFSSSGFAPEEDILADHFLNSILSTPPNPLADDTPRDAHTFEKSHVDASGAFHWLQYTVTPARHVYSLSNRRHNIERMRCDPEFESTSDGLPESNLDDELDLEKPVSHQKRRKAFRGTIHIQLRHPGRHLYFHDNSNDNLIDFPLHFPEGSILILHSPHECGFDPDLHHQPMIRRLTRPLTVGLVEQGKFDSGMPTLSIEHSEPAEWQDCFYSGDVRMRTEDVYSLLHSSGRNVSPFEDAQSETEQRETESPFPDDNSPANDFDENGEQEQEHAQEQQGEQDEASADSVEVNPNPIARAAEKVHNDVHRAADNVHAAAEHLVHGVKEAGVWINKELTATRPVEKKTPEKDGSTLVDISKFVGFGWNFNPSTGGAATSPLTIWTIAKNIAVQCVDCHVGVRVGLDISVRFCMDKTKKDLNSANVTVTFEPSFAFDFAIAAEFKKTFAYSVPIAPLINLLPPMPLFQIGPVPVILELLLRVSASASATVDGKITLTAGYSAKYKIVRGVGWTYHGGAHPISHPGDPFSVTPGKPAIAASASLTGQLGASISLGVRIEGIVEFDATISPYIKADVTYSANGKAAGCPEVKQNVHVGLSAGIGTSISALLSIGWGFISFSSTALTYHFPDILSKAFLNQCFQAPLPIISPDILENPTEASKFWHFINPLQVLQPIKAWFQDQAQHFNEIVDPNVCAIFITDQKKKQLKHEVKYCSFTGQFIQNVGHKALYGNTVASIDEADEVDDNDADADSVPSQPQFVYTDDPETTLDCDASSVPMLPSSLDASATPVPMLLSLCESPNIFNRSLTCLNVPPPYLMQYRYKVQHSGFYRFQVMRQRHDQDDQPIPALLVQVQDEDICGHVKMCMDAIAVAGGDGNSDDSSRPILLQSGQQILVTVSFDMTQVDTDPCSSFDTPLYFAVSRETSRLHLHVNSNPIMGRDVDTLSDNQNAEENARGTLEQPFLTLQAALESASDRVAYRLSSKAIPYSSIIIYLHPDWNHDKSNRTHSHQYGLFPHRAPPGGWRIPEGLKHQPLRITSLNPVRANSLFDAYHQHEAGRVSAQHFKTVGYGTAFDTILECTPDENGDCRGFVFEDDATVELRGLGFVGFYSSQTSDVGGPAIILSASSVSVDSCLFHSNSAPSRLASGGDILLLSSSSLSITSSYIANSRAGGTGGSIAVLGNSKLNMDDVEIVGAKAETGSGGAIAIDNVDEDQSAASNQTPADAVVGVMISRSHFKECSARKFGGAVFVKSSGTRALIKDSRFTSNFAHQSGGAVAVVSGGEVNLIHSSFTENRVRGRHGASALVAWGERATIKVGKDTSVSTGSKSKGKPQVEEREGGQVVISAHSFVEQVHSTSTAIDGIAPKGSPVAIVTDFTTVTR